MILVYFGAHQPEGCQCIKTLACISGKNPYQKVHDENGKANGPTDDNDEQEMGKKILARQYIMKFSRPMINA